MFRISNLPLKMQYGSEKLGQNHILSPHKLDISFGASSNGAKFQQSELKTVIVGDVQRDSKTDRCQWPYNLPHTLQICLQLIIIKHGLNCPTRPNVTFISQFGEAASIAADAVTHIAEVLLDLADAILHKSCLVVAARFNSHAPCL